MGGERVKGGVRSETVPIGKGHTSEGAKERRGRFKETRVKKCMQKGGE